jgi:hypothetical protein
MDPSKISILLYSHSEYSFLWKATIPLLVKYASEMKIYFLCDSTANFEIPESWTTVLYDPNTTVWSERIHIALQIIPSEYILYLQEDWLLLEPLKLDVFEYLLDFMESKDCEFLMSFAWDNTNTDDIPTDYDGYILQKMPRGHLMHPAIWKKTLLEKICKVPLELKNYEGSTRELTRDHNCYCISTIKNQNHLITKSLFFPHYHALNGGRWVFNRFPELKEFLESYGIDTSTRQIETEWMKEYK